MRVSPLLAPGMATGLVVLLLLPGCSRPAGGGAAGGESSTQASSALPAAGASSSAPSPLVAQLAGHIWRVTGSASSIPGSIYIFVSNGTLLETSCKETYRIATWSADAQSPVTFQVVEDGRPAFTGTILESTANSLRVRRRLNGGETDELKLVAVTGEFVCPDLRRTVDRLDETTFGPASF